MSCWSNGVFHWLLHPGECKGHLIGPRCLEASGEESALACGLGHSVRSGNSP